MKSIQMRGLYEVYACDTFFYLDSKKETEKNIIYSWKSFCVGSINGHSSENWDKEDIYLGFQAIYGFSKNEVRERLLELVE